MDGKRRKVLKAGGGVTLLSLVAAAGWLRPGDALAADWNNRISSIRIDPTVWVQICVDTSFQGSCVSMGQSDPRLTTPVNDAVSSYRIFAR